MQVDFLNNGVGVGTVADRLLASNMDPNALRPFVGRDGRSYMVVNRDGKPQVQVCNTAATLRKDEWITLDTAVIRAARPALRVWGDLVSAGLTYNIPNGMGTTILQHQTMTDAGEATHSMDGLRDSNRDRPHFDLVSLPLPIVHADFSFSLREIMVSRNTGAPLDTTMAEQSARKIAERTEKLLLGTIDQYTYGGGTIYGLTNFPQRLTTTVHLPTGAGWTPQSLVDDILGMIQQAHNVYFYGPYNLYFSPGWNRYLDSDYSAAYNGNTVRSRIAQINGIASIAQADFLSNYQILLVQRTPDVVRAVNGMSMTTVQWDEKGGMQKNFKIIAIMVPQIRSNSDGNTGIVHATAA